MLSNMDLPLILSDKEQFAITDVLPTTYRGYILRGANVVSATGESGNLIIQSFEQPLFTIRFKEFAFFRNVTLLFKQNADRALSFLALKNNINYHLKSIGSLRIKEGHYSILRSTDESFNADYEKDKTYQTLEIDWASEIARETVNTFPQLQHRLTLDTFKNAFVDKPFYPAAADVLTVVHEILHSPYASSVSSSLFEHKIREYFILLLVGIDRIPAVASNISEEQLKALEEIAALFRKYPNRKFPIAQMATKAGMNTMKFKQSFKATFNSPPFEYQMSLRMQEALELLQAGRMSIKQVAAHIGYRGPSSFTTKFREHFGFPPSKVSKIE